ncbi:hypothetical protein K470DRAFT_216657 [Piedraia hortae CBS 480.64]|uniref:37S ribosomal protein mrp10, mitochondrial n=1 Tax=Piedraia hortae CBS 480.64 TaxID=1314780 RepID=A0A6A7C0Y5_9PEZI|nr:hypothetical protein K470DRAFT_216657 [Piedraia hortae CBS 480.64]
MVLGKNNRKALAKASAQGATAANPQLPPLSKLRVRNPNKVDENPCVGLMSSVLGCWASQGYSTQGCAMLEQQLRRCMDTKRLVQQKKSRINHHLSRFYPMIIGPHKRN